MNTKYRSFQYKILNNILYLNKIIFEFRKVKSLLCSFCKSADETIINLFSKYIWNQIQIFFWGYITISDVTSQSAILGLTDYSMEQFLMINHYLFTDL